MTNNPDLRTIDIPTQTCHHLLATLFPQLEHEVRTALSATATEDERHAIADLINAAVDHLANTPPSEPVPVTPLSLSLCRGEHLQPRGKRKERRVQWDAYPTRLATRKFTASCLCRICQKPIVPGERYRGQTPSVRAHETCIHPAENPIHDLMVPTLHEL